jgi:hypothetical protein
VTLTVKNGDDLAERFRHLSGPTELWMETPVVAALCSMALWVLLVLRSEARQNSGDWHPHLHMIALAEVEPSQETTSRGVVRHHGDSFIVDVRPIVGDLPRASWSLQVRREVQRSAASRYMALLQTS